jgi:hypothetical protein
VDIQYHPGKANVVADAFSRKNQHVVNSMEELPRETFKELERMEVEVVAGRLATLRLESDVVADIIVEKKNDPLLEDIRSKVLGGDTQ